MRYLLSFNPYLSLFEFEKALELLKITDDGLTLKVGNKHTAAIGRIVIKKAKKHTQFEIGRIKINKELGSYGWMLTDGTDAVYSKGDGSYSHIDAHTKAVSFEVMEATQQTKYDISNDLYIRGGGGLVERFARWLLRKQSYFVFVDWLVQNESNTAPHPHNGLEDQVQVKPRRK